MAKVDIVYLKQYDLQPYYYAKAKDSDGNAISLSGATIRCTMKEYRTGTIVIDRQTTGISITGASSGEFQYEWVDGDTDTAGKYNIEFEVTPATGGKWTIPTNPDEPAEIKIISGLDTS